MKKKHFLFPRAQDKSVMLQLFIQLLTIVLLMVTFLLLINTKFIETVFYAKARADLNSIAQEINEIDVQSASFYDEVKKVEYDKMSYIEILDGRTNALVYSTAMNDLRKHFLFDFDQNFNFVVDTAHQKKLDEVRTLDTTEDGAYLIGREMASDITYVLYRSVLDSGNVVNVYLQLNIIQSNAHYTSAIMRTVICILGTVLMIAFFIYSWKFTRPLIEINDVTKHVAKMDFSKKCVSKSNNELGQLAENINSMSDSLSKAMGDLQEKNRQLEIDIEHEHKMEKSRREFVSNVSHELKTPLAIIQGYAEGLKLGVSDNPEDNEEYLDIIIEESKRMNTLVLDLLELSYYESGTYKLNEVEFSLNNMIDDYILAQKKIVSDKNITVEVNLKEDMQVYGDEQKLGMVLNNYFSNALSHCKNEMKIKITSEEYDEYYRISVFNTGENISEEILEEMWSNFFRGDKSHRREEGRFGIGLSIVAAIQNMHSMNFGCENKENGVRFWFDVKKVVKDLSI